MKKTTMGQRILVFFISLICIMFIFPFLSYFINDIFMWKIIPTIPILSFLIAAFYDKFKK